MICKTDAWLVDVIATIHEAHRMHTPLYIKSHTLFILQLVAIYGKICDLQMLVDVIMPVVHGNYIHDMHTHSFVHTYVWSQAHTHVQTAGRQTCMCMYTHSCNVAGSYMRLFYTCILY